MNPQFENFQKLAKDQMDATLKAFGVLSKGTQTIAGEVADYSKKSFEHSTATLEKLAGVKTLDKAFEIHTDYLKSSYDNLVAQATKMGELYQNVAKEAFKPMEGIFAQAQSTVQTATKQASKAA